MAGHPQARVRGAKLRRWLLIGVLFCLCGVGWTLIYRLPQVAEALAPFVAARFGYELSIERVERLDLGGLQLRGLQLSCADSQAALQSLRAKQLELQFGRGFFAGDLQALEAVRARGLSARILTDSQAQEPASRSGFVWPQNLPLLDLEDLNLSLESATDDPQQLTLQKLQLDRAGRFELRAQLDGRSLEANGSCQGGALHSLSLEVDGQTLCQQTEVDLARIGEGRLTLEAQLPIGSASQEISVQLAGTQISWQTNLRGLDLAQLEARLPFEVEPGLAGTLDLQSNGELDWTAPLAAKADISIDASDLVVWGLDCERLTAEAHVLDEQLRIPSLHITQSPSNSGSIEQALLPLRGLDPRDWLPQATARIALELTDVNGLLAHWQPGPAPALNALEHRLALVCELGDSQLTLIECGLESTAGDIALSQASIDLRHMDHPHVNLSGQADLHDLGAIGGLLGRTGWAGALQGSLQLDGQWPEVSGQLDLAGDNLELEGYPLGHLELAVNSGAIGRELELSQLSLDTPEGSLRARLRFDFGKNLGLDLLELVLQREGLDLQLQEPARIEIDGDAGHGGPLAFEGSAGQVRLEGSWAQDDFEFDLDVPHLNPTSFEDDPTLAAFAVGAMQFDVLAQKRNGVLHFQSSGQAAALKPAELPEALDLRWQLSYEQDQLSIAALEIKGRAGLQLGLTGELPLELADGPKLLEGNLELALDASLPLAMLETGASGILQAKGTLGGSWAQLSGQLEVLGDQLRLAAPSYPEQLESTDLHGQVSISDAIHLTDVSIHMGPWIEAQLDGELDTPLDLNRWLQDPKAALEASEVSGHLELARLDITKLRPLLLSLTDSAGALMEGEIVGHFGFEGPLLGPKLDGQLEVTGGRLRPGGGLPPVEQLTLQLELDPDRVQLSQARGTLGAAPFELAGQLEWSDDGPLLDLHLEGDDLLLLRNARALVRADTALRVTGPLDELLVSGSLDLTTGHYSPDVRLLNLRAGPKASGARGFQLFALRDPPLRDMRFDISLGAQQPFAVRNTRLKGSMRPELQLTGTGLVPLLAGTVYLEPTRLKLPASQFDLPSGTIRFVEENPFVPELDILGQTRMLGYDIRADISGPYDQPELQLSSTPPLAQEDLFLLALTGRLPEDPERSDALSTANTVAIYLAQDSLARLFSNDGPLDEDTILERLEFSLGEDVSKNGTETFDIAFRLTSKGDKSPERREARNLFLATERDKFEDYNFGLRWVLRFKR